MLANVNSMKVASLPKGYFSHLAQASEQLVFTLSQDVCNEQGAIVLPQGRTLDRELALKLHEYQLAQPIELCLEMQGGISAKYLYGLIFKELSRHGALTKLAQDSSLLKLLKQACMYYQSFPLFVQKLSVMRLSQPGLFSRAVYCGCVALLLCRQLQRSEQACLEGFCAGLMHDIGMLSLEPKLLNAAEQYQSQQWQDMQLHCAHALTLLESAHIPRAIVLGIVEHHERYDGSGYPHGKHAEEISFLGQVVALADVCIALYRRDYSHKTMPIDALLPILQLNSDLFSRALFNGLIQLIRSLHWSQQRHYADHQIPHLVNRLIEQKQILQHDYDILFSLLAQVEGELPADHGQTRQLLSLAKRIRQCLNSSGIMQQEHNRWMLASCRDGNAKDFAAIESLELLYSELIWQMRIFRHLIYLVWQQGSIKHQGLKNKVRLALKKIEQYHKGLLVRARARLMQQAMDCA